MELREQEQLLHANLRPGGANSNVSISKQENWECL